jgi:hypothetical protein
VRFQTAGGSASATFSSAQGAWKCTAPEAFALKARAAAGRRKNQTLQRIGRMHTSERRDEVEITLSSRVQTLVEAQVKQAGYPNASRRDGRATFLDVDISEVLPPQDKTFLPFRVRLLYHV